MAESPFRSAIRVADSSIITRLRRIARNCRRDHTHRLEGRMALVLLGVVTAVCRSQTPTCVNPVLLFTRSAGDRVECEKCEHRPQDLGNDGSGTNATAGRVERAKGAPSADHTRRRLCQHSEFGFAGWLGEHDFEARLDNLHQRIGPEPLTRLSIMLTMLVWR